MMDNALHYHIDVFWSAEDECWIADLPDLCFCSAHGDTPDDALRELQVAMAAWLESAHTYCDPIPEPRYRPAIYAARPSA